MVQLLILLNNADTNSFKFKRKITDKTGDNGTKLVEEMIPLVTKYFLENF